MPEEPSEIDKLELVPIMRAVMRTTKQAYREMITRGWPPESANEGHPRERRARPQRSHRPGRSYMTAAMRDLVHAYTDNDPTEEELVLLQTPAGWMWFAGPLGADPVKWGGPYPLQRHALEEAMGECPGWQLVRVA